MEATTPSTVTKTIENIIVQMEARKLRYEINILIRNYEQEQHRDKHLRRKHTVDAKRQGGGAAHPHQGWRDNNHKQIQIMTMAEYTRLVAQIAVLKEVAREYPTKTIENIIVQMEVRRKEVWNAD